MSIYLLFAVTLTYALIALLQAKEGNVSMALVFAGYTLANLGLIVAL